MERTTQTLTIDETRDLIENDAEILITPEGKIEIPGVSQELPDTFSKPKQMWY